MKQVLLLFIGSLLINASFAQCPAGETEVTIQFIEDGSYPNEVRWDYQIQGTLSGSGPYIITEIITTCIPVGDLTIVGCDTFGDTWNGAIFQVDITEDGSINGCSSQNGCYVYKSTVDDSYAVTRCSGNPDYEVTTISIGNCGEIEVITNGCTNPDAINYNACAISDDGSCIIPSINNNCINATPLIVAETGSCESNTVEVNNLSYNSANIQPTCDSQILYDAFYKFAVPPSGQILFSSNDNVGISIYNSCDSTSIVCDSNTSFEIIGNLPIGDTLILQIFENYFQSDFTFCLEEATPSNNNNCVDATPIVVATTGNCESNYLEVSNLYYNSVDIQAQCDYIIYDIFYEFIVPSSGQILFSTSSSDYVGISIYSSCDSTSLFCDSSTSFEIINDLPVGETLILQIFEDNFQADFSFCLEEITPSINNNCVNAISIAVAEAGNCESNTIDVPNLYFNSVDIQTECDYILYDVFYQFVVPPSGQMLFSASDYVGLSIYTSCDSTSIFCDNSDNYEIIRNLPIGDTLILQIFEDNFQSDFSFCLEEVVPLINNNCADALPLTIASVGNCEMHQVTLTNFNYNSTNIEPSCKQNAQYDAFYEFTVPASEQIYFSSSTYNNAGIAIYNACDGEAIFCEEYIYNRVIGNLPAGDLVILQIFEIYGETEISFCIEEAIPTSNNTCSNPQELTIANLGECASQQVNIDLTYNALNKVPNCNTDAIVDAYYEFVVPQSGSIKIDVYDNIGIALYNNCNSTSLYCNEYVYDNIILNLTAGDTILLQLFNTYNLSNYSFCIEEVTPAINNNCNNAAAITVAESGNCAAQPVTLNNFNYNTTNIAPPCENGVLYDAFYEFIVPESGQILFSTDNSIGLSIYQVCNSNSLFCDYSAGNEIIRNLPAGEAVILQIFEDYNRTSFSFCLEEVVPTINNLCLNAEPFIVNEPGNCVDNYIQVPMISNNTDVNPYCASFVMADAFYSFIVPESGHIAISTSRTTGIAIYDDCLEQSFYCSNNFSSRVITGLNPADTLILQAFQTNNPRDFELCLEDAPPSANNNCIDAISIDVFNEGECEGNAIIAPLTNNSVSINPSCDYIAADIFYKVTVPENGQFRINTNSNYGAGYSIYTTCDTNSLICKNSLSGNLIQDLPANEEILLQFFQNGIPNDFEFCIETAIPTSNNDCSNALPIDLAPTYNIFERTDTLNIRNNYVNINPYCHSTGQDAFYTFNVPENGKVAINISSNFGIALYNDCNSESIFCDSYIDDIEIIADLPVGETVILQIFEKNDYSNITFSIAEVTDNFSCENASLLCEQSLKGTTIGGTQSSNQSSCTSSFNYMNNLVWYSFLSDNSGSPLNFEVTKTKCTYQYDELYVSILSNACGDEYVEEACLELYRDGDKEIITSEYPIPNQQYYLMIGNDSSYGNCSFEINVIEGVQYDCCPIDYTINAWCNNLDTENYYVNINVNNFGENPSGFNVLGTNYQVKNLGATTIGPIPNGINALTLQGIDKLDCTSTKNIDFNCTGCSENVVHENVAVNGNQDFSASKFIESNVKILSTANIKYEAGDSVILKQGFIVEKGAGFTIDIEDCEE